MLRARPGSGRRERHVRAAVQRHGLVQAMAGGGPPVTAAVRQVRARLVDEHETAKFFFLNGFHKQAAQGYDAFGVALGGMDAFFRPRPRRSTACHTAVRCNAGPPVAARACPISVSVASGCAVRLALTHKSRISSRGYCHRRARRGSGSAAKSVKKEVKLNALMRAKIKAKPTLLMRLP